jgi:hypothetical protein
MSLTKSGGRCVLVPPIVGQTLPGTAWADAALAAWKTKQQQSNTPPIVQALFAEPNPVVIKSVLHRPGEIPSPAVRLPLLPASPDSADAALRAAAEVPLPALAGTSAADSHAAAL